MTYELALRELIQQTDLKYNDEMIKQWLAHLDVLMKWNKAYSLTAVKTIKDMLILHIMDSLSIAPFVTGHRVADVGSGAGFPGVTLAILFPEKQVILIESNGKKCQFLQQVMYDLKLKNITVVNERVENYHPTQTCDQVISRAFSSLAKFVEVSAHLCAVGGQLLAMKGEYPEAELQELSQDQKAQGLKGNVQVQKLSVIGLEAERHLIILT